GLVVGRQSGSGRRRRRRRGRDADGREPAAGLRGALGRGPGRRWRPRRLRRPGCRLRRRLVLLVGGAPMTSDFVNRLKVFRAERNWTQADLAEQLGVSRQTVQALEKGRYDPSLPLAFRIARLFGRPIEAIFVQ